mgnify:CR=1 FL=1
MIYNTIPPISQFLISFVVVCFMLLLGLWVFYKQQDEFILNSLSMSYPKDIIDLTYKNLKNLKRKIRNNEFPFDGFFEKYIAEIK